MSQFKAEIENVMQVGFIGAGRMATALAKGMIDSQCVTSADVVASDVHAPTAALFSQATGALTVDSNAAALSKADIIFLAVKPQVMPVVLEELKTLAKDNHLFVSIAAGVTLQTLEAALSGHRVVRVMPNTPALVGEGAAAYASGQHATADDLETVQKFLSTVGIASEVTEKLLDAVTGLSGSGPAYAFEIIEALSDGGVLMGLPRATATQLAAQTLLGAAKMVLETGEHPGALKDAVTSPGGTTIVGLHALETGGLRGTLMNAVQAATEQSQRLGKPKSD